ncbi:Transcriptional activator of fatty acid utilization, partial [Modicella reniformis]
MENLLGGLVQTGDRSRADMDTWKDENEDEFLEALDPSWQQPHSPDSPMIHHRGSDSPLSTDMSKSPLVSIADDADDEDNEINAYDRDARKMINELSENMDSMSLDNSGFIKYLGNSSGIDLLQRNQILKNGYLMMPVKLKDHQEWLMEMEAMVSQVAATMPLPPRDLADHLIECYWTFVHPHLPIVHKPTFMRQYRNPDPEKRPPVVLLHAMFAIASRFSEHPEINGLGHDPESFGDEYFSRAKRLVDVEYELPRISSIQSLLLMVSYRLTSTKCGGRIWVMLGMAARMAQDLGMHRNSARWHLPPLETEIRKRLWWAIYVMDRNISASMGRPMAIDDDDCDVDFPFLIEQDWTDPDGIIGSPRENNEKAKEEAATSLRYFEETIKLSQIIAQILRRLKYDTQTMSGPNAKINRWVATIHSAYYSVLILLHRPSTISASAIKTRPGEPSLSLKIAVSAANSITHLLGKLDEDNHLQYAWTSTSFEVFISSLIHLTNSASTDMTLHKPARITLVKNIEFMKTLGIRWFNSAKFAVILEDLMCAHLNFDGYKPEGRSMDALIVRKVDSTQPIILRDQNHPSGGTLLFAPKAATVTTPSSSTSTPASSPQTPTAHQPENHTSLDGSIKFDHYGASDPPVVSGINDPSQASFTGNNNAGVARPVKKGRNPTSQRNSLLFPTSAHPVSNVNLPGATSGASTTTTAAATPLSDQSSMLTFASLTTPG